MKTQDTKAMEIVMDMKIAAEPSKVYQAASTETGIKGWWNTRPQVSEKVGGTSQMNFNKNGTEIVMVFRVDELQENVRVAWTCTENGSPYWVGSKVSFALRAAAGGTALRFVHDNFNPEFYSREGHEMVAGGWQHFMNSFKTWCETGVGEPWA